MSSWTGTDVDVLTGEWVAVRVGRGEAVLGRVEPFSTNTHVPQPWDLNPTSPSRIVTNALPEGLSLAIMSCTAPENPLRRDQ